MPVCKNPLLDVSVSLWVSKRLSSLLCVCLALRNLRDIADGSRLYFFISFICSTLRFRASFEGV